jgi:hypothetical protein
VTTVTVYEIDYTITFAEQHLLKVIPRGKTIAIDRFT